MKRKECSRRDGKLCKSRNVEMWRSGEVKIVISRSQACKCYKWHPHWRSILTWVLSPLEVGWGEGKEDSLVAPELSLAASGRGGKSFPRDRVPDSEHLQACLPWELGLGTLPPTKCHSYLAVRTYMIWLGCLKNCFGHFMPDEFSSNILGINTDGD